MKKSQMDDDQLRTVIRSHLEQSTNYNDAAFSHDRIKADQLYRGDLFGNEVKGRSQVVSRDVAESIDTLMPSLLRVFCSSDDPVRFDPTRPGEEALAAQMTDYVSYIWNSRNEGYMNYHAWFKAALLYRIGILKVWWDATPDTRKEKYEGLSEDQFNALGNDPDVEIETEKIYPDPRAQRALENHFKLLASQAIIANQPPPQQPQIDPDQLPKLYDVEVKRTVGDGRIRIKPVPTEEFIFAKLTTSAAEKPFFAHRSRMTKSELRAMGFDPDVVDELIPEAYSDGTNGETEQRFSVENVFGVNDDGLEGDPSLDALWVIECYGPIDFDGDGIAEYRKVTVAGSDAEFTILENIEIDDHPFALLCPVPTPFKLVGTSITDQTREIQEVKSALTRQMLDNFYLNTHARPVVNPESVNMDDLLNPRPGSPIRAKSPQTDVVFAQPPSIGAEALQAIEYFDQVREIRTGVTRYNQGLNADELNPTATGAALSLNAGNMRMEAIARTFAETGVKRAFQRIYSLVSQHQSRPDIVRLRGSFVALTPTDYDTNFDCSVHVGLGTGNRDQEFSKLMALVQLDATILAQQVEAGFPPGQGPVVTLSNAYNKLRRLAEVAGLRQPDQYYSDPAAFLAKMGGQMPQKPQQPDPRVQAAQIDAQHDNAALQEKQREFDIKHQLDVEKTEAGLQLKAQKQAQDHQLRQATLAVDVAKNHVQYHIAGTQDGHAAADQLMQHHVDLNPAAPPMPPNTGLPQ